MKMLVATALLLLSAWAWAQDGFGPKTPAVQMAPAPLVTAMQGKSATVPLSFRVLSGYSNTYTVICSLSPSLRIAIRQAGRSGNSSPCC